MDLTVRPIAQEELEGFVRAQGMSFGEHVKPEDVAAERLVFEPDRSLAVFDGDRQVGGTIAVTFEMTVPGGVTVPTAGVTSVGVLPTHRRRGILTGLMREQLEDVHRRGEPLAVLWASESVIYGRFGYGVATFSVHLEVGREHSRFLEPVAAPEGARLVERDEALRVFPEVYDRIVDARPGLIRRTTPWWDYLTTDHEHWREGASAYFYLVVEEGGRPEGFAYYRLRHDWTAHVPSGQLELAEMHAASPRVEAQLWRYLLDVDLVAKTKADHRRIDDSLLFLLADPRRLTVSVTDGMYVRVVDAAAALAARRYRAPDRLVIALRDSLCEWNEGTYSVEGGPDGAVVERSDADPDLVLDATALGSVYLGGVRFRSLADGLRVEERSPGAIERADVMFGSDATPWAPAVF